MALSNLPISEAVLDKDWPRLRELSVSYGSDIIIREETDGDITILKGCYESSNVDAADVSTARPKPPMTLVNSQSKLSEFTVRSFVRKTSTAFSSYTELGTKTVAEFLEGIDHQTIHQRREDLLISHLLTHTEWKEDWESVSELSQSSIVHICSGNVFGFLLVCLAYGIIPVNDPIGNSRRWWECLLPCATCWVWITASFLTSTSCAMVVGCSGFFPWKECLLCGGVGSISMSLFWSAAYVLCVYVWAAPYPIPFQGILCGFASYYVMACWLWARFPHHWRKAFGFQKQMLWLLTFWTLFGLFVTGYYMLLYAFANVPLQFQFLLAPAMVLYRQSYGKLLNAVGYFAAGSSHISVTLIIQNCVLSVHIIFLSVCIGSLATLETTIVLLGLDFAYNVFSAVKVARTCGDKDQEKSLSCAEDLMSMVLSETLELMLPLTYLACFVVAYLGPNGHLIGNVRSSHWHFKPVRNPWDTIFVLLLLTFADAISLIASYTVLLRWRSLSLWRALLIILQEHGAAMAIQHAFFLVNFFCAMSIGCAADYTLKFEWVRK